MSSLLPSIVALGLVALAAAGLAQGADASAATAVARAAAARTLGVAVLAQAAHFVEEASTGFHAQLPALFGLPAMPFTLFVAFNLAWIAVWLVAIPGVRSGRRWAFFAAWFLAIAGTLNGVAHPLMALRVQRYFPGLLTAPVVGVVSLWLVVRLRAARRD